MKAVFDFATKALIVSTASLGALGLISSSVYASLTATASNTTGGSITSGTLKLSQAPSSVAGITGGFVTAIAALAPGDSVRRYIDLTNTGTLDRAAVTLITSASEANVLTTDGTKGLQVAVNECSTPWTSAGVCGGTSTTVLASTSLLDMSTAKTLVLSGVASGVVNYLQFIITLPAGTEVTVNGALPVGTVQGLTTALTWTFTQTLRTNTETNS